MQAPFYQTSANPYAKRILEQSPHAFTDLATENFRGRWLQHFSETIHHPFQELHVEVGCNGGHVLLGMAEKNPHQLFVGLDWKFKQISLAADKAVKRGIKNVIFLRAHANRISQIFGEREIHSLSLFFPDPWPKARHHKHRLFQASWLAQVESVLSGGGTLELRTDHQAYFDHCLSVVEERMNLPSPAWRVVLQTRDRHAGNLNAKKLTFPEVTLFEKLFIQKNLPVYQMKLERLILSQ